MSDHTYQPSHGDGHHGPHVTPPWLLLAVFFGLITLTGLTVVCADPGLKEILRQFLNQQFFPMTPQAMSRLSLWVAMGIATVKATLVALYFMHLRWDKPINAIVAVACFLFVALFIGFSMADTKWARADGFRGTIYNDIQQAEKTGRQPGELHEMSHGTDHADSTGHDGGNGGNAPAPEGGTDGGDHGNGGGDGSGGGDGH